MVRVVVINLSAISGILCFFTLLFVLELGRAFGDEAVAFSVEYAPPEAAGNDRLACAVVFEGVGNCPDILNVNGLASGRIAQLEAKLVALAIG